MTAPAVQRGRTWQLGCYLFALAVAVLAGSMVGGDNPLRTALVADVAATVAVFAVSMLRSNHSMYDPYWSVAPPVLLFYWLGHPDTCPDGLPLRQVLVSFAVVAWGVRLTWNFLRGWPGLDHEDWRYGNIRKATGAWFPLASFGGIHLMPTLLVFAGCLSVFQALSGSAPLGWLDLLATVWVFGAITIETVADNQLRAFVASKPPKGTILRTGLWSISRHPNYLGELGFWWGLFFFALAAEPRWLPLVGPLSMTALFVFASLPLIEKRSRERRPNWDRHVAEVPVLVPLPGKRAQPWPDVEAAAASPAAEAEASA